MKRLQDLNPPPRNIPFSLSIKALLGGWLQQFGWIFAGFGMMVFMVFAMSGNLFDGAKKEARYFGEKLVAPGKVVEAQETSMEVNEREVVEYVVDYQVGQDSYSAICYETGWKFDEGSKVQVEYLVSDPSLGRIKGSRFAGAPFWVGLLLMLFPAVGLLLVASGFRSGLKNLKLLKSGHLGHGEFVSKEPTNTRINEQTVYNLTFKFKAESTGREHFATAKNHELDHLMDEEFEPLLYMSSFPEDAVMFDNLPGSPQLGPRGKLVDPSPLSAIAYLMMPALTVGCVVYGVVQFAS